jgi:hypothetical protein
MYSVILQELAAERARDLAARADGARRARRSTPRRTSRPWRPLAGPARVARTRLTGHAHA